MAAVDKIFLQVGWSKNLPHCHTRHISSLHLGLLSFLQKFLLLLVSWCCCHCSSCCLLAYEVIANLFVPLFPMLLSPVNVQISLLPLLTFDCCHLSTPPVFRCLAYYAVIATHELSLPILCVLLPFTTCCCYHFLAVIVANIIVAPLLTWCCPCFMFCVGYWYFLSW